MVPPRPTPDEDAFEEDSGENWLTEDPDSAPQGGLDAVSFDEEEEEEEDEPEAGFEEEVEEEDTVYPPDEEEESDDQALDELEAEELEMLTEDEAAESLPVDEAEELRQMQRVAIELEASADAIGADEFVCKNCFLVKRVTQLADKRKRLCRDCV
jgi:hypothetical protein